MSQAEKGTLPTRGKKRGARGGNKQCPRFGRNRRVSEHLPWEGETPDVGADGRKVRQPSQVRTPLLLGIHTARAGCNLDSQSSAAADPCTAGGGQPHQTGGGVLKKDNTTLQGHTREQLTDKRVNRVGTEESTGQGEMAEKSAEGRKRGSAAQRPHRAQRHCPGNRTSAMHVALWMRHTRGLVPGQSEWRMAQAEYLSTLTRNLARADKLDYSPAGRPHGAKPQAWPSQWPVLTC